jgi:hypothetical protein
MLILLATTLAASVHTALALSGYYVYANEGSYFSVTGPSQYWYFTNNAGYCGSGSFPSCSPYKMRWTYSNGFFPSNSGRWNNIDSPQNASLSVYIPSVNATTSAAPYTALYNGISTYGFDINQNIYYNQWVSVTTLYDIRLVDLDDNTAEPYGSTKVGYDEIRLLY